MTHLIISIILAVIAIGLGLLGRHLNNKADAYGLYVEASSPSELSAGIPSFFGGSVIVPANQQALTAPYSKQQCVYFEYEIQDLVDDHDSEGSTTQHWQTISRSQPTSIMFGLQASGGVAWVNANDAKAECAQSYEQFLKPDDMQNAGVVGKVVNVVNHLSQSNRRVLEHYIPVGQQIYAAGTVMDQGGQPVFVNDQRYPLTLTSHAKSELVKSGHRNSALVYGAAGLFLVGAIAVFALVKK